MQIAKANTQVFQTVYIDTDAKEPKDKIVLIEEIVESLPEATAILTSMMKEPYFGVVVCGGNIDIAKFRSKLAEADSQEGLGKKNVKDIILKIHLVCSECKCGMVYFKAPKVYEELPKLSTAGLFDSFKKLIGLELNDKGEFGFLGNILGYDATLEKQYKELDLKEHKKLLDYVKQNEKDFDKLRKEVKKTKKDTNLDDIYDDLVDYDYVQEYLGSGWEGMKFYIVPISEIDKTTQLSSDLSIAARQAYTMLLEKYAASTGGKGQISNIIKGIAYNKKEQKIVFVTTRNIQLDKKHLPWWPSSPTTVTLDDISKDVITFAPLKVAEYDKRTKERRQDDDKFWSDPESYESKEQVK